MLTEESLLEAIRDNPTDEFSKLVYADWLEERGELKKAECIRLVVKLHEFTKEKGRPRDSRRLLGYIVGMHYELFFWDTFAEKLHDTSRCEYCLRKKHAKMLEENPEFVDLFSYRNG